MGDIENVWGQQSTYPQKGDPWIASSEAWSEASEDTTPIYP